MKICVIVPVYNDWYKLQSNLHYFREAVSRGAMKSDVDVVFVDNGSDTVGDVGSDFGLEVCTDPGSYSARNFALRPRIDRYDYFAFTDADCLPEAGWLEAAIDYLGQNGSPLLAGGVEMVARPGGHSFVEAYDLLLGIPQERYVRNGYAVTANLFVRNDVFKVAGLFDDTRFSGGDAELCRRAGSCGFELDYLADSLVRHPARVKWHEIINKVKRVTGGQTGNGAFWSRVKFLIFNLLPPGRAYIFILGNRNKKLASDMAKAFVVVTSLWPLKAMYSVRYFFGGRRSR
jgi:glycosyltransferase involved in cell wall biosynthesis